MTTKHNAVSERECQCGGIDTHLLPRAAAAAISVRDLVERAGYSCTEASEICHIARETRCELFGPELRASAHEHAAVCQQIASATMKGIGVAAAMSMDV
jgi:hypothetical protein